VLFRSLIYDELGARLKEHDLEENRNSITEKLERDIPGDVLPCPHGRNRGENVSLADV